jgi:ribosome-associated protein
MKRRDSNCFQLFLFKIHSLKTHLHEFELTEEFIELIKLLKLLGIADTGSDAKQLVDDGEVKLNGTVEFRKRAKLRRGDIVSIGDNQITIV